MNLQENISKQLRRRTNLLDRVIDNLLPNMYPCDYNSSDHFVEGVLDEIIWFLRDEEELQGIERIDIENYILDYKYDELTEYFNERCIVLKNDNLQENIQRIRQMMGLDEQSFLQDIKNKVDQDRREKNPYRGKEYNPENTGDFSNSKVKDVVWRAGGMGLNPKSGGIWFAENKEDVEKFAWSVRDEKREGKPYYINLQNPRYYDGFWHGYLQDAESQGREGLMDMLVDDGHDGIIIDTDTWNDTGDEYSVTSKQYVVFNPENIKPA